MPCILSWATTTVGGESPTPGNSSTDYEILSKFASQSCGKTVCGNCPGVVYRVQEQLTLAASSSTDTQRLYHCLQKFSI